MDPARINTISTIAEFDRCREQWEHIYSCDPYASVFLSWRWLRAHFLTSKYTWLVLAFRRDVYSAYSAFLPLVVVRYAVNGAAFDRELFMGGHPRADYTGMLAMPAHAGEAIAAFGRHIGETLAWDNFHLHDVLDPRVGEMVHSFARTGFVVRGRGRTVCPYLRLPPTWDGYLAQLTANARQQLRAIMRKMERMPGYRLLHAGDDTLEEQIEALLLLHHRHWGTNPLLARRLFGELFDECFATGCLYLASAWDGTTPVAALAGFTDETTGTLSFYITGYNDEYAKLSPGRFIVARSIRDAIESGYRVYDFLNGDEPYKSHFCPETRYTTHTLVTRAGLRASLVNTVREVHAQAKLVAHKLNKMRYGPQ